MERRSIVHVLRRTFDGADRIVEIVIVVIEQCNRWNDSKNVHRDEWRQVQMVDCCENYASTVWTLCLTMHIKRCTFDNGVCIIIIIIIRFLLVVVVLLLLYVCICYKRDRNIRWCDSNNKPIKKQTIYSPAGCSNNCNSNIAVLIFDNDDDGVHASTSSSYHGRQLPTVMDAMWYAMEGGLYLMRSGGGV